METYTTLSEIKQHLNIETTFNEDDAYLLNLLAVAEISVYEYCNGGISETDTDLPKAVKHASLLLA